MSVSIQDTQQLLKQLPPEGIAEFNSFIEFLRFKYQPHLRSRTLSQALGLLATEQPAPTDAEVKKWLTEARLEKYG
jgi:hypothetical protein